MGRSVSLESLLAYPCLVQWRWWYLGNSAATVWWLLEICYKALVDQGCIRAWLALLFSEGGAEVACWGLQAVQELCGVWNCFIVTHGFVHWFVRSGIPWEALYNFPVDYFCWFIVWSKDFTIAQPLRVFSVAVRFGTPSIGDLWLKIWWTPISMTYRWNICHYNEALGHIHSSTTALQIDLHHDHLKGRIKCLLFMREWCFIMRNIFPVHPGRSILLPQNKYVPSPSYKQPLVRLQAVALFAKHD